ncbi:hypothetical protein Dsin_019665 [Dipteronia sinensis]|uniref:Uncharacterized protein n=1 Tax=Dipteronia sinensis TaxID=43782 RepID=A0AAE0E483_9ROSI|nr:hypothetical protein Dsin_019665 [Dipteronia sinensis]
MSSKFWWGSRGGKQKINWIKWESLCLPKGGGGLGFKHLSAFNQSLLAKQAWRILKGPGSVAAQVLKAKYFINGDFLSASANAGCSHICRSLIWGRTLLVNGLRWVVGDGQSIRVFKDSWIPRPTTFKTITADPRSDLRVAALFDANRRGWDVDKLNSVLLQLIRMFFYLSISWGV